MTQTAHVVDSALETKIRSQDFWKIPEAAEFLRCSPDTVRSRVKAGTLGSVRPTRTYLIPSGEIIKYLHTTAR